MNIDTGMCTQSLTLPALQLCALPTESNTCFTINDNGDKFGNDDDNDNGNGDDGLVILKMIIWHRLVPLKFGFNDYCAVVIHIM